MIRIKRNLTLYMGFFIFTYAQDYRNQESNKIDASFYFSSNCSLPTIDVRLSDLVHHFNGDSNKGLVEFIFPPFYHVFLCHARNPEELRRLYTLSHVICRQMGFMTFTKIETKKLPERVSFAEGSGLPDPVPHSVSSRSVLCAGHEQSVSACEWKGVQREDCDRLVELSCGACQRTLKLEDDRESRLIQSPGYPLAHAFDVWCEWQVTVPPLHFIRLGFQHATVLPAQPAALPQCRFHKPHIEVVYGPQDEYKMRRFCRKSHIRELDIPYTKARVRFFTGLYSPRAKHQQERNQGMAIAVEAVPITSSGSSPLAATLITILSVLTIAGVILYVYFRKKQKQSLARQLSLGPNMPGRDQLQRAYEFQRRYLQSAKPEPHIRYRSASSNQKEAVKVHVPLNDLTYNKSKEPRRQPSETATPRNIFHSSPQVRKLQEDTKYLAVSRLKTNLLDRFSGSNRSPKSSTSSVFLPITVGPSFQIYHSLTSEPDDDDQKETSSKAVISKETII